MILSVDLYFDYLSEENGAYLAVEHEHESQEQPREAIATSSMTTSSSGKRIQREMMELNRDPPPDCSAGPKGDNLFLFTFIGPADNPLVPGIAHLYLADTAKHDDLVAEWTLRFAK